MEEEANKVLNSYLEDDVIKLITKKIEITNEYLNFLQLFEKQKINFNKISNNELDNFSELFNFINEIFCDNKNSNTSNNILLKLIDSQNSFIKETYDYFVNPFKLKLPNIHLELKDSIIEKHINKIQTQDKIINTLEKENSLLKTKLNQILKNTLTKNLYHNIGNNLNTTFNNYNLQNQTFIENKHLTTNNILHSEFEEIKGTLNLNESRVNKNISNKLSNKINNYIHNLSQSNIVHDESVFLNEKNLNEFSYSHSPVFDTKTLNSNNKFKIPIYEEKIISSKGIKDYIRINRRKNDKNFHLDNSKAIKEFDSTKKDTSINVKNKITVKISTPSKAESNKFQITNRKKANYGKNIAMIRENANKIIKIEEEINYTEDKQECLFENLNNQLNNIS